MPRLPGVNHLDAVRALGKAGFRIARQGEHTILIQETRITGTPHHNPADITSTCNIVADARMSDGAFGKLRLDCGRRTPQS